MARILLIDDDPQFCSMLQTMLEAANYQVTSVSGGEAGLEAYRSMVHDLIITDIFMPEKDGLETIQELREINPNLKIMAISGGSPYLGRGFNIQIAELLGADKSVAKPVRRSEFLADVASLLQA